MLLFARTLCSVFLTLLFFELLEFLRNIFQVAVKKLSLSHRSYSSSCFLRISPPSTRRNCNLLPYFVERPIFFQYYVLNICSFLLFLFYSVFNDHGFASAASDLLHRFRSRFSSASLAARTPGLVEMMGIEPMTPCLQGRCSPN